MMNTTYYGINAYYSVYHSKKDEVFTDLVYNCNSKKIADIVVKMLRSAYTGLGFTLKLKDSITDNSKSNISTLNDKTDCVALLNFPFKESFKKSILIPQTEFDLSKSEPLQVKCSIIYASSCSAGSFQSLQGKTIKHVIGVYQKEAVQEAFDFLVFFYSKNNFSFTVEHFSNKFIRESTAQVPLLGDIDTTESLKWVEISDVVYRVLSKLDLLEYRRFVTIGEEKAIEWKQV